MNPVSSTLGDRKSSPVFDVARVRSEFPALQQEVHGKPLVYLDSAATAQKPRAVIEAVERHYREDCANVHRGVHQLSLRASEAYDGARQKVRRFLNASSDREIIFVRGATEAINLVAQSYARPLLRPGDEVLVTWMEHHSNIVPWQMVCEATGAELKVVPIENDGSLRPGAFEALLGKRTRIAAFTHVSNALGTVNPVRAMAAAAREVGAISVVDGAQAAPHSAVDVRDLGVDFYAVSGHKVYGPTGIGVLYGREELLNAMPPYQGGGDMILSVTFEKTLYNELPYKFEAGTPNIAGAIGLGAAVDFLESLGMEAVSAHEGELLRYATKALSRMPGVTLVGTAAEKAAVLSFNLEGIHPHDVGTILDTEGVAVRTGHHCAQPVMERFGVAATTRASFGIYNTLDDVDALVRGIQRVQEVFGQ